MAKKDKSEGASALSAGDDGLEQAGTVWPKAAVLRNHSGNSVVEPITGKFLQAGGSENIELRDQEHADAVADNVRALSENIGQVGILVLDFI